MRSSPADLPTVLVVQNSAGSTAGRLPQWIADAGGGVHLLAAYDGHAVPTDPGPAAAVVLLGGGLMPDADLDHPWLPAERELVRTCRARGVPVLGICLGGQLIAQTFEGGVRARHGTPERGVVQIDLRAEAADDPLLGGLEGPVPAVERHEDAITALPPDAVWLASSTDCPYQAFRLDDTVWGVQFHPEADAARVATWDRTELIEQGHDPDALVAEARRHADAMDHVWPQVIARFVDLARAA